MKKVLVNYVSEGLDVVLDYARLASQRVCFGSLKKKDARLSNYKAGPGGKGFLFPGFCGHFRIPVPIVDHGLLWIFSACRD